MSANKITNNLFSYEFIGFDIYIVYDGKSGMLRTLSREDGSLLDARELQHGLNFDTFKLVSKQMHLDIIDNNKEGSMITQRDINASFAKN